MVEVLKEKILHFLAEMKILGVEVKSITFDENTYDLLCRYMEKNCSPITCCKLCPFMAREIELLGIKIKKG